MDKEMQEHAERTGHFILAATAIALSLHGKPEAEREMDSIMSGIRRMFATDFAPQAGERLDDEASRSDFAAEVERVVISGMEMAKTVIRGVNS